MDIVTTATDPWGRPVLTHVAWEALWVSIVVGVTFLLAHAAYMVLSANQKPGSTDLDALEAKYSDLPERITRHSLMARLFHWVMAGAMFVLLVTAFFPIMGVQFNWIIWHWVAGLVLTGSIIFHIIHVTFWLDFWSIWVGPKDIPDFKAELLRETGHEVAGPKPGKYPLGNRLYHLVLVFVGMAVIVTGVMMLPRIDNPIIARDPYYILTEGSWGYIYVAHGLVGVSLVGLTIAHIYFAARPEKWWITKAMVFGWVTRRQYLQHHEPSRWQVRKKASGA